MKRILFFSFLLGLFLFSHFQGHSNVNSEIRGYRLKQCPPRKLGVKCNWFGNTCLDKVQMWGAHSITLQGERYTKSMMPLGVTFYTKKRDAKRS